MHKVESVHAETDKASDKLIMVEPVMLVKSRKSAKF